jgi:hypothetical protein
MNLKLLAEQIANRKGRLEDFVFKKDIQNSIIGYLGVIVKQDYTRRGRLYASTIQTLNCVDLIEVDKYECCGPEGCLVLRTKVEIPQMIETKSPTPFEYVGTIDLGNSFTQVDNSRLQFFANTKNNRFPSLQDKMNIHYAFRNNYIYVLDSPGLEVISITAPFAEPHLLDQCCKDCSGSCYDKEGNYVIPTPFIADIKKFLFNEYQVTVTERVDSPDQIHIN